MFTVTLNFAGLPKFRVGWTSRGFCRWGCNPIGPLGRRRAVKPARIASNLRQVFHGETRALVVRAARRETEIEIRHR